MSAPNEPYANSLGILFGIGILWVGTLLLVVLGKMAWNAFHSDDAEESAQAIIERVESPTTSAIPWRSDHGFPSAGA